MTYSVGYDLSPASFSMARDGGGVTVRLKKPELVSSPALGEFLRDFLTFMTIHTPQIMKAMNVPLSLAVRIPAWTPESFVGQGACSLNSPPHA